MGLDPRPERVIRIERDKALYPQAPSLEQAYQMSLSKSPLTARQGLAAQWYVRCGAPRRIDALGRAMSPHVTWRAAKGALP